MSERAHLEVRVSRSCGTFHMELYAFNGRNVGNQAREIGCISPF